MRTRILLQKLTLLSVRLLDLKAKDLSDKKPLNILLRFLTDETRKGADQGNISKKQCSAQRISMDSLKMKNLSI